MTEQRKLIRLGNSSFAIALPKTWVELNKLEKGDAIFLNTVDGELVISPREKTKVKENKEITIDIDGKDADAVEAEFSFAYINNYNLITLKYPSSKFKPQQLKNLVHNFIGIEVVEQNNEKTVLRDILDINEFSVKEVVRRMDNIIRSMFEDLVSSLNENEGFTKMQNEMQETDIEVNKLFFLIWKIVKKGLCNEILAKKMGVGFEQLPSFQWLALNQEFIGDEIKRISRFLTKKKLSEKQAKDLKEVTYRIYNNYTAAMTAHYKGDRDLALEVASKNDKFALMVCEDFFEKNPDPIIAKITERLKTIQGATHYITRGVPY